MKTFTRYAVVGLATTALDFGLFCVIEPRVPVRLWAHVASTAVVLPLSFLLQRNLAFRSNGKFTPQAIAFLIVTTSNVAIWQPVWLSLPESPAVGKAAAIMLGIAWNYVWFYSVVFRTKK